MNSREDAPREDDPYDESVWFHGMPSTGDAMTDTGAAAVAVDRRNGGTGNAIRNATPAAVKTPR
jgi:hypothetical protein